MSIGWIRKWVQRKTDARAVDTEWNLVVDGRTLARLRAPEPEDMFWVSFEIVPVTEPVDPCLMNEDFWAGDTWRIVDPTSGRETGPVIASMQGIDRTRSRVRLRGVHP